MAKLIQDRSTASNRTVVETWLDRHIVAWEARDVQAITAGLHPEAVWLGPTSHWVGSQQIRIELAQRLAPWQRVQLKVRRLLIDVEQSAAAAEWACRYAGQDERGCQELLGGTVLDFEANGRVKQWRTYLDPVRRRTLADWTTPLPDEGWSPYPDPGPSPARTFIEQLLQRSATAWSSHDLAGLSSVFHDEICIQPPWDYLAGRAAAEAGAQVYFTNYRNTQVTPRRILIDPSQPYFGVCEQTFACTNPDTGRRGEDHDFAFFEIAQGKLRYWRTYFDTTNSAQAIEKTMGFLSQHGVACEGHLGSS